MTIRLDTRELAGRLLIIESEAGRSSDPTETPSLRVYEKLRRSLGAFAGVVAFHSLASRALALARMEDPGFSEVRVTYDGTLEGLGATAHPINFDKGTGGDPVGLAGVILIARLLGLLHIFLGETLTLSLLRVTWPGAELDDRNFENRRKA